MVEVAPTTGSRDGAASAPSAVGFEKSSGNGAETAPLHALDDSAPNAGKTGRDLGEPATAGRPLLSADLWERRHTVVAGVGLMIAVTGAIVEAVVDGPLPAVGAFFAALIGVAVLAFAATLPGVTLAGFATGGFTVLAGLLAWSYSERPLVVWSLYLVEGAILTLWVVRWLRTTVPPLVRIGAAWLGLAYWILGTLGALLAVSPVVAVQKAVYGGLLGLVVLAIVTAVWRHGTDPSIGVAAAFLVAIGLVLLSGAGNLFEGEHVVPDTAWGQHQEKRFWGGPALLYHPNSLAVIAVAVALRIGLDVAFRRWQQVAALILMVLVLTVTNSRTALLYAGCAAALHALLVWRRRHTARASFPGLPHYRGTRAALVAGGIPVAAVGLVLLISGGIGFLLVNRYGDEYGRAAGITSGRTVTWQAVWDDFVEDTLPEQLLGNADNARGVVQREGTALDGKEPPKLTTDNAAVGALRRAGAIGVVAFLVGLGLLLWHATRTTAPAWLLVAAGMSWTTIATSDWLLGGTGGTLWVLLLAGEAWLVHRTLAARAKAPQSAPAIVQSDATANP